MSLLHFSLGLIVGSLLFKVLSKCEKIKRKAVLEYEHHLVRLVERSKDILYYYEVKPEYKHKYTSPSVEDFLGEGTLEELNSNPDTPFNIIHPDDYEIMKRKVSGEIDYSKPIIQRLRDKEGNYKWFEEYTTPIYENGELVAIQGIMRNVDEKMKLQQELEYKLTHDTLTTVYNREFFERNMEICNQYIDISAAVICCDLDELKYCNDNYGHKKGDKLIQEAAKLLKQHCSENAIVSRIGGDEFVVLLVHTEKAAVEALYEKLLMAIDEYNTSGNDVQISMSIGYAFSEHSLGNMDRLFIEADQNMYEQKRTKKRQRASLFS